MVIRQGIGHFLKHYRETSMEFLGQLPLPIDTRSVCCLASLEFAVQEEKYGFTVLVMAGTIP